MSSIRLRNYGKISPELLKKAIRNFEKEKDQQERQRSREHGRHTRIEIIIYLLSGHWGTIPV